MRCTVHLIITDEKYVFSLLHYLRIICGLNITKHSVVIVHIRPKADLPGMNTTVL